MNPNDFSWKEDQRVTVINPTGEDFQFMVHSKQYLLKAGQTATMPGYIAWAYVYGISCRQAQEDKTWNRWNEDGFRQTYYERFVAGISAVVETAVVAAEPEVHTFDDEAEDLGDKTPAAGRGIVDSAPDPAPGTGTSFEKQKAGKHGNTAKV